MKKTYVSTSYSFKSENVRYYEVSYIPGITIMCAGRPWIKGKLDTKWVGFMQYKKLPQKTNKKAWEEILGLPILPLGEENEY